MPRGIVITPYFRMQPFATFSAKEQTEWREKYSNIEWLFADTHPANQTGQFQQSDTCEQMGA